MNEDRTLFQSFTIIETAIKLKAFFKFMTSCFSGLQNVQFSKKNWIVFFSYILA